MEAPSGKLTPNVKRLIVERMTQLQIEATKEKFGAAGVGEIAQFLMEDGHDGLGKRMRSAMEWTRGILRTIRSLPGSEAYPTDEDAAAAIMRRIEEKRKKS